MRSKRDNGHNAEGFLLSLDEFCTRYCVTLFAIAEDLSIDLHTLEEKHRAGNYYMRQNQVAQTITLIRVDKLSEEIPFSSFQSIPVRKLYLEG